MCKVCSHWLYIFVLGSYKNSNRDDLITLHWWNRAHFRIPQFKFSYKLLLCIFKKFYVDDNVVKTIPIHTDLWKWLKRFMFFMYARPVVGNVTLQRNTSARTHTYVISMRITSAFSQIHIQNFVFSGPQDAVVMSKH